VKLLNKYPTIPAKLVVFQIDGRDFADDWSGYPGLPTQRFAKSEILKMGSEVGITASFFQYLTYCLSTLLRRLCLDLLTSYLEKRFGLKQMIHSTKANAIATI
jgi:hypothetical protein